MLDGKASGLSNKKSDQLATNPIDAGGLIQRVSKATKLLTLAHILASALAGWYLMIPRVTLGPKGVYQAALNAPLSTWGRQGPYDTLSSCNRAKEALSELKESKVRANDADSVADEFSTYAAECVAQDDPRFKGQ
jgi:hypothetical protein